MTMWGFVSITPLNYLYTLKLCQPLLRNPNKGVLCIHNAETRELKAHEYYILSVSKQLWSNRYRVTTHIF